MKILLISPLLLDKYLSNYKNKYRAILHKILSKGSYNRCLSLPILAAITPKEHQVFIQKTVPEKIDFDGDYDLIGISSDTTDSPFAYKIADEFRRRGKTVVLGGWHPSALPYEAKQHADSVVIGEAEETWIQLLEDFKEEKLKDFYRQSRPVDVNLIPKPLSPQIKNVYLTREFSPAIQATRGCPHQCEFCSETIMDYRKIFRQRPVESVIEEIKLIPDKFFIFHDASLTINPTYTKKLFSSMIGLKKHFFCNGNVDILGKDEELLYIAKKAGCVGWLIGFESISKKSLESVGKKTNIVENYIDTIDKIHDKKMMVSGSFVFGFDGDTTDVFDKTYDFAQQSKIDMPDAMVLTPFPGTPLYERLEKEDRIITKDWSKYDHRHVVFKPKNMGAEELFELTKELFNKFFSINKISIRVLRSIRYGYYPFLSTLFQNLTVGTLEMNVEFNK